MKLEYLIFMFFIYLYIGFIYISILEDKNPERKRGFKNLLILFGWPFILLYYIVISKKIY